MVVTGRNHRSSCRRLWRVGLVGGSAEEEVVKVGEPHGERPVTGVGPEDGGVGVGALVAGQEGGYAVSGCGGHWWLGFSGGEASGLVAAAWVRQPVPVVRVTLAWGVDRMA